LWTFRRKKGLAPSRSLELIEKMAAPRDQGVDSGLRRGGKEVIDGKRFRSALPRFGGRRKMHVGVTKNNNLCWL